MKISRSLFVPAFSILVLALGLTARAQPGPDDRPERGRGFDGPPPGGVKEDRKVLGQFDRDANKWLDASERQAARDFLAKERAAGRIQERGPRGRGPARGEPAQPGMKVSPRDVKSFGSAAFYASNVVRTLFLQFENSDWEKELSEFHNTDVEVPATLTVDGKEYPLVGVHFRGASSYGMVGAGSKRSLNIAVDYVKKKQDVLGYRTLNLLNSHEDPSFLRAVLFYDIAGHYIPTPKANFVRVVINGENWGLYVSVEQFNKDFVDEWFGSSKGARWKVPGSPNGRGGLAYLGDDPAPYKKIYEIKSKDDPQSWAALVQLCKVLNETPASNLERALTPLLDIDGALKFLALENTLINNDGYWTRASDYAIYKEEKGKFHILPQDANETFSKPGGPGFGRGRGTNAPGPIEGRGDRPGGRPEIKGVELDPLVGLQDASKPLLSKLLAVPALRTRYLGYVRQIAETWLDWNKLGPLAHNYHNLIAPEVKADTRKLDSFEDFEKSLTEDVGGTGGGPGRRGTISLQNFAQQRRAYLLQYTAPAGK